MERAPADRRLDPGAPRAARAAGVLVLVLGLLIGLAVAWHYTRLDQLVTVERLTAVTQKLQGSPLGAPLVVAGFLVGSLLVLPLNLMILVTVVGFNAWPGMLYAYLGSMAASLLTYWLGRHVGRDRVRRLFGARGDRVKRAIAHQGIPTVMVLRVTPLAPFTIVNMIAGAIGVRGLDYSVGTALGLIPGIVALALVGDRLVAVLREPTPQRVAVLGAIVVAMAGLGLTAQWLINRRRVSPAAGEAGGP